MSTKGFIYFFILMVLSSINAWGLTARQIITKNRCLTKPLRSCGTIKLVIKNRGVQTVKQFRVFTKKYGSQTRSRINFIRPTRMQFLIYSKPGKSTQQWIKFSSGRIRRVASGSRGASWANSHFYYEDLQTYSISKFKFTKLSDAVIKDYKKKNVLCYRIAARTYKRGEVYSKRILYIDKKNWQIRRVKFFQRGNHTKTLSNYLFKKINGINTPRLVYMEPVSRKGSYSYLLIQQMTFNTHLSDRLFRRSSF